MANHYSDPTADAAIGTVDEQIFFIHRGIYWLKGLKKKGMLRERHIERARSKYTGFYRHLFEIALTEIIE